MPRGNGTGPTGLGPMTGRGAGYCAGFGMPGYANMGPGCRMEMGWGRGWARGGRGFRHWFWATGLPGWARLDWGAPFADRRPMTAQQEMETLKAQAEQLNRQLQQIQQRMEHLESENSR